MKEKAIVIHIKNTDFGKSVLLKGVAVVIYYYIPSDTKGRQIVILL